MLPCLREGDRLLEGPNWGERPLCPGGLCRWQGVTGCRMAPRSSNSLTSVFVVPGRLGGKVFPTQPLPPFAGSRPASLRALPGGLRDDKAS